MKMIPELLIIDDDEVLLMIISKMFKKVNPERNLNLFSSGKSALDRLEELKIEENTCFLMLDINLKDMSGWDFLKELESRNDQFSKVFLITSSVSQNNQEIAKKYSSIIGFFEKPITFDVINKIESIIESNTTLS
ncbi:MAG: response regulator [Algoriphagus sp.]|nr:response regulator [Algoriphagus sp.]